MNIDYHESYRSPRFSPRFVEFHAPCEPNFTLMTLGICIMRVTQVALKFRPGSNSIEVTRDSFEKGREKIQFHGVKNDTLLFFASE